MSTRHDAELKEMKDEWEDLGISKSFPCVHHFSSDKFKTKPPKLEVHYKYCVGKDIRGENLRTLKRAQKTVSLFEKGKTFHQALCSAWEEFPIITR